MHTIFVTLEEFLANGGTLIDGKGLFTSVITAKGDDRGAIFKQIGWYDAFTEPAAEGMVVVSKTNRTFHMNTFLVYVAIEAKPIYK